MRNSPELGLEGGGPARGVTNRNHFGAGGDAPYDLALSAGGGMLRLVEQHDRGRIPGAESDHVDLARFLAPADRADASVIARSRGTVLDVGCGPGRMVRAAIIAGHLSLGIDVSAAAIAHATEQGLPVLRRSVFDALPREGEWDTVLLLDGNIGIGGDPTALLARAVELITDEGRIVVEVHPDRSRDRRFTARLVDAAGRTSLPFPWQEVGADGLRHHARGAGLTVGMTWTEATRSFVCLRVAGS